MFNFKHTAEFSNDKLQMKTINSVGTRQGPGKDPAGTLQGAGRDPLGTW